MNSIQGLGSTQGMMGMQGMMGPSAQTELTDDQKSTVQSILADYDAENITAEDAQEIFQKLADAGITPAKGLKEAIEEAGFDAEELRTLGMPQGQNPPPPPPPDSTSSSEGINMSALESLQTILDQYDLTNLSEEDESNLISQLSQTGLLQPGNLINLSA